MLARVPLSQFPLPKVHSSNPQGSGRGPLLLSFPRSPHIMLQNLPCPRVIEGGSTHSLHPPDSQSYSPLP